jgi:acyl-CoA reductase-like NAD-dependent aldehyde dehydrogenase
VYEVFKNLLVRVLGRVKIGDPRGDDTIMGSLIDERAADEVMQAIESAVKLEERLLFGGKRLGLTYAEPALIEFTNKEAMKKTTLYNKLAPIALIMSFKDT